MDEKTQVQALDRTQPLLPIAFDATEKRTHDYVRHGTANLFAALNVGTGEVVGECRPSRDGDTFLAFLKKGCQAPRRQGDSRRTGQPFHPYHPGGEGVSGE